MMIKRTGFSMFIALISLSAMSQSFIDTTKVWSVLNHRLPSFTITTETFSLQADTTIESMHYRKLFRSTNESQSNSLPYGYLRETMDGKVFFRTDTTGDRLLYDFNLSENDVVTVYGISGYSDEIYLDTMRFLLSEKSEISINGNLRNLYHLNPVLGEDTLPDATEFWIEGIGSLSGLLHYEATLMGGNAYELLCYSHNDTLLYQHDDYNVCYYVYTDLAKSKRHTTLEVFPNPTREKFTIRFDDTNLNQACRIEIYTAQGKCIIQQSIQKSTCVLTKNWEQGIYMLKISCNGQMFTERLIVY
ncbi:MAG: T9SS type A sorting domain-containing protein [Bacteroidota bacterium]|nr:T9SS type A sorting domain-containing protein [Bacteroidota bacterium]